MVLISPIQHWWPPRPCRIVISADRQLPDKAIDLMDEAASRIRMEIDSKPEKLDRLERKSDSAENSTRVALQERKG